MLPSLTTKHLPKCIYALPTTCITVKEFGVLVTQLQLDSPTLHSTVPLFVHKEIILPIFQLFYVSQCLLVEDTLIVLCEEIFQLLFNLLHETIPFPYINLPSMLLSPLWSSKNMQIPHMVWCLDCHQVISKYP